jgi:hypothetical protein
MKLPLWIRRLPHNLSTIRPRGNVRFNLHYWAIGLNLYFDSAPGDKYYLFHFDSAGVELGIGPLHMWVYLEDTG